MLFPNMLPQANSSLTLNQYLVHNKQIFIQGKHEPSINPELLVKSLYLKTLKRYVSSSLMAPYKRQLNKP